MPFVQKTILSPLNYLAPLLKNQLFICESLFLYLLLFHGATCIHIQQVLKCSLYSEILVNPLTNLVAFCVMIFYKIIMLPANKDSFTSSFLICMLKSLTSYKVTGNSPCKRSPSLLTQTTDLGGSHPPTGSVIHLEGHTKL